jgi:hypothetical protein
LPMMNAETRQAQLNGRSTPKVATRATRAAAACGDWGRVLAVGSKRGLCCGNACRRRTAGHRPARLRCTTRHSRSSRLADGSEWTWTPTWVPRSAQTWTSALEPARWRARGVLVRELEVETNRSVEDESEPANKSEGGANWYGRKRTFGRLCVAQADPNPTSQGASQPSTRGCPNEPAKVRVKRSHVGAPNEPRCESTIHMSRQTMCAGEACSNGLWRGDSCGAVG